MHLHTTARRLFFAACAAAQALLLGACAAATQPADAGRPRADANAAPYPVALALGEERRAKALANWAEVVGEQSSAGQPPQLLPVTATPAALPTSVPATLRLPRVVIDEPEEQSEEETRESLRRFIASASALIGAEPRELTLVRIDEAPGGLKTARYRQNPFLFPLRNGFGEIDITFTPDLKVTGLSSTAIPDAEPLRRALAAVTQQLTAGRAAASLANRAIVFDDASGHQQTRTVANASEAVPRELVVFPVRRTGAEPSVELRLAWEVLVGDSPSSLLVYVDAVTGEQLGATHAS